MKFIDEQLTAVNFDSSNLNVTLNALKAVVFIHHFSFYEFGIKIANFFIRIMMLALTINAPLLLQGHFSRTVIPRL